MNQPKVTVVIPIYNVEKYLNRCVESVVSQTYKNLEIILVDDGSSDHCPEMCDQWAEKDCRIKVIHKVNAGLGMARNTGIENATGEYIFFFDSDDYVDLTLVEKCVSDAGSHGSDVVIFGCADAFDNGTVKPISLNVPQLFYDRAEILRYLLPGMFTYAMGFGTSCCMKMFKLDVIQREGLCFYSERELISEDTFFALEFFSKIKRVSILNENLYFYYKRMGSLTSSFRRDRQEKNNIFLEKSLAFIKNQKLPDTLKHHVVARYHMYSIAALKHIAQSELSLEEKQREFDVILCDSVLRNSLDLKVIKVHKLALRIFLLLLKIKAYWACKWLIEMKK